MTSVLQSNANGRTGKSAKNMGKWEHKHRRDDIDPVYRQLVDALLSFSPDDAILKLASMDEKELRGFVDAIGRINKERTNRGEKPIDKSKLRPSIKQAVDLMNEDAHNASTIKRMTTLGELI